jgi:purine-binding chemotaxis protein CheW
LEGMINLRESLVPIIDPHIIDSCTRLGFPPRGRDEETEILVVELRERTVGLVTGPVRSSKHRRKTIEPVPDLAAVIGESAFQENAAQGNAVQRVAKLEGWILLLLSPKRLFSEEETKALEKTKALRSVEESEKVAAG